MKSQQSSDDSQNPQSLPSPPPEVVTAREPGERGGDDEIMNGETPGPSCPLASRNSRNRSISSHPEPRQQGGSTDAPSPNQPRPPPVQHQQNAEAGPSQPVPRVLPRLSKTEQSKGRKKSKEQAKEKRRLKQLAKAGKLLPQPRTDAAGCDSDDEYWVDGDDIPDHLLIAAAEQGEMGKAWRDRGSATPVPEPPQRPHSPAKHSAIPISAIPISAIPIPPISPPVLPPISPPVLPPVVRSASPPPARQHSASPSHSQPPVPHSQGRSSSEDRIDPVESLKRGCPASCVRVHYRSPSYVSDQTAMSS